LATKGAIIDQKATDIRRTFMLDMQEAPVSGFTLKIVTSLRIPISPRRGVSFSGHW
jgi:hypothetical protein